jgi:nitroreductase
METAECIKTRTSVRDFKKDPIPDNILLEILDLAVQAPSAGNLQDWEFIVVKDARTKRDVAVAALNQQFIWEAPIVIVACSNLEKISSYGERGRSLYSLQDTATAIENLMLAAWDKGIGSCWVGAFDEKKVKDTLSLPEHIRPVAIIPVGYPSKTYKKPSRRKLREVLHFEHW